MVGIQLVLFYSEHQRPSEQMFWPKKKLSWQISREWKNSLFKQFILLQTASLCLHAHTFVCTYHHHHHCICPPQCSYDVTPTTPRPWLTRHTWHYTRTAAHVHIHTPHHRHPPLHTCTHPFSRHKSSQPALRLRDFKGNVVLWHPWSASLCTAQSVFHLAPFLQGGWERGTACSSQGSGMDQRINWKLVSCLWGNNFSPEQALHGGRLPPFSLIWLMDSQSGINWV